MNGEVVREWFARLAGVESFVLSFSSTAREDLYEFSRQTLEELIGTSPLRQNALCRHCQSRNLGFCRPNTFANLAKTFRDFVDEISIPVQEVLLYRCFDIARQELKPPYPGRLAAQFRKERVDAVCPTPAGQQALFDALFGDIPREFYAKKPNLVDEAVAHAWTFDELCAEIVR